MIPPRWDTTPRLFQHPTFPHSELRWKAGFFETENAFLCDRRGKKADFPRLTADHFNHRYPPCFPARCQKKLALGFFRLGNLTARMIAQTPPFLPLRSLSVFFARFSSFRAPLLGTPATYPKNPESPFLFPSPSPNRFETASKTGRKFATIDVFRLFHFFGSLFPPIRVSGGDDSFQNWQSFSPNRSVNNGHWLIHFFSPPFRFCRFSRCSLSLKRGCFTSRN